jgi:hypothetical protein
LAQSRRKRALFRHTGPRDPWRVPCDPPRSTPPDPPLNPPNPAPRELCESTSDCAKPIHKVQVAGLAERQFGRVTWVQLRELGAAEATVNKWVRSGYLLPVRPRVYAVGHLAKSQEIELFEAVLFAGPGALLSHGTAAWWRGLLNWPVKSTHISTPRQIKWPPGLKIHGRRHLERETVNGLPVTTVTQTMLDLAATEPLRLVRRALAELDFRGEFEPSDLQQATGRGRPGSAALRRALRIHLPELARTRSELEVEFLLLCEGYGIPRPLMNRTLYGVQPDAWWPDFDLVVELDGDANHRKPAQRSKDRRKEVILREHGLTVLRYDYDLTMRTPTDIRDDLLRQMAAKRREPGRRRVRPRTDASPATNPPKS